MHTTIDDRIRAAAPALALGFITACVQVRPEDPGLGRELEDTVARLGTELTGVDLSELPELRALRRFYRALGKDPTRYRGSNEALLRRIVQGKGLAFINTAVDSCNLICLESRHSLGAFDLDKLGAP